MRPAAAAGDRDGGPASGILRGFAPREPTQAHWDRFQAAFGPARRMFSRIGMNSRSSIGPFLIKAFDPGQCALLALATSYLTRLL